MKHKIRVMLLRKKGERAVTRREGDMTPGSQESFDYKNESDHSARELSGKLPVGPPCLTPHHNLSPLDQRHCAKLCGDDLSHQWTSAPT